MNLSDIANNPLEARRLIATLETRLAASREMNGSLHAENEELRTVRNAAWDFLLKFEEIWKYKGGVRMHPDFAAEWEALKAALGPQADNGEPVKGLAAATAAPAPLEVYPSGTKSLDKQEGGKHYKGMKIQPVEYANANGLDFLQGSVVKYVTRHKVKNGAEDVRKAIHFLELILELQYAEQKEAQPHG